MAEESKYKELLSKVHQGVPSEKSTGGNSADVPAMSEIISPSITPENTNEPSTRVPEKRKRKPQADYQDVFFNRIDFTHRKPLYITATTHRRLMRIVHLMDESKATISSYVENIILNHLETFKEDIDTIYQTNNLNPTE